MSESLTCNVVVRRSGLLKVSIGLLALMVSGPFILSFHTAPIPSFWSEWWAGVLGTMAAIIALFTNRRSIALPFILTIPVVLLLMLLLQFLTGRVVISQIGLLYALYLLWAALLIILGRLLRCEIGLHAIVDVMATGFAIGALVGGLIALAQWIGVAGNSPWIFFNGGITANLAQANQHTHFSWLGIASAIYLRGRERLGRSLLWFLIFVMAMGSVLSGSRSVFLYPVILLILTVWARWRNSSSLSPALMTDVVLLLPMVIVLSLIGTWISPFLPSALQWLVGTIFSDGVVVTAPLMSDLGVAGSRLYGSVSGPSARVEIARAAWAAFFYAPWMGSGVGNYSWASFVAASTAGAPTMVAEHAHNFVLHCLVEFGAPMTLLVLILGAFWFRRFVTQRWELPQLWCAGILGIGAVHGMLEYPYWYAYFLGPTALLLGATDTGKVIAVGGRRMYVYVVLLAICGAVILADLRKDYAGIEAASYQPLSSHPDREQAWRISMDRLLTVYRDSLLSPWALQAFVNLAEPSRHLAADRAALCEKGIRFAPVRVLVARCAMHLAIAGRNADAQQLGMAVLAAYPSERAATLAEWQQGAKVFPELVPLLREVGSVP